MLRYGIVFMIHWLGLDFYDELSEPVSVEQAQQICDMVQNEVSTSNTTEEILKYFENATMYNIFIRIMTFKTD